MLLACLAAYELPTGCMSKVFDAVRADGWEALHLMHVESTALVDASHTIHGALGCHAWLTTGTRDEEVGNREIVATSDVEVRPPSGTTCRNCRNLDE
jgi:hypothetical protein